jgi:hypothetical protein
MKTKENIKLIVNNENNIICGRRRQYEKAIAASNMYIINNVDMYIYNRKICNMCNYEKK